MNALHENGMKTETKYLSNEGTDGYMVGVQLGQENERGKFCRYAINCLAVKLVFRHL